MVDKGVSQEQVHDLLFSDKLSWQGIIQDLISTEQLNPWDLDLSVLTNKFLERVRLLEEADFFVSSKVLFAAALLLRIKSEILLNQSIPSLDFILFGKEEEKSYKQERIELEDEIPELVPRTPIPRARKVTLQELMSSLGKAIQTETRRIQRVVTDRQYEIEAQVVLPRGGINLKEQTRAVYSKLRDIFSGRAEKLSFSELSGGEEQRISTFVPLLHLDHQHKVVLEQEGHLEEIWIWLKKMHEEHYKEELDRMRKEVDEELEKLGMNEMSNEEKERAEEIQEDFSNPIG